MPTVAESGFPGFDANVWYMLMAPPGMPAPMLDRWVAAVNTALSDPVTAPAHRRCRLHPGRRRAAAEAAALLRRDAERYAALIRQANIRIE